jgi:hypothetical protein
MSLTLTEHTEKKLKSAATQFGVSEAEVVERALDILLLAEEVHGLARLKDDIEYWQGLYTQSAALTDERLAQHTHGEG